MGTPYDAFIAFMNVLQDLERRLAAAPPPKPMFALGGWRGDMACVA